MKHIATIILFLWAAGGAFAQWAGPDVHVLREVGNPYQTVTVGSPNSDPEACYVWSGPHIVGDEKRPVIECWPMLDDADTAFYTCKRISRNGVDEDQVRVIMKDSAVIVSVEPLYECYNHGDEISLNQFFIVTQPGGYEDRVTISADRAVNNGINGTSAAEHSQTLTFTLENHGYTNSTYECDIYVVNSALNLTAIPSVDLAKIKRVEDALNNLDKVKEVQNKIDNMKFLKSIACKPSFSFPFMAPNIQPKRLCCPDHTSNLALQVSFGAATAQMGLSCEFPLAGIPIIGTVNVVLGAGGFVTVGPFSGVLSFNTECMSACIPMQVGVYFEGGLGVNALGGSIFNATATIRGQGSVAAQWCFASGEQDSGATLAFDVMLILHFEGLSCITMDGYFPLMNFSLPL